MNLFENYRLLELIGLGQSRRMTMKKGAISNGLLSIGVLILMGFAILELAGVQPDPLLPAFSAFFIGCTAVLDRVETRVLK
jgi:hypothetical protein